MDRGRVAHDLSYLFEHLGVMAGVLKSDDFLFGLVFPFILQSVISKPPADLLAGR
jgi:hypothetical protein